MKQFFELSVPIAACLLLVAACNKDEEITQETARSPIIELDSPSGIYTVKVGRVLTIAPTYRYADGARYVWTADGQLLSSEPAFSYSWDREQELYLTLQVDTPHGHAEEELKVEVLELAPPTISLVVPPKGLKVLRNTEYLLAPDIRNDDLDDFRMEWLRDGQVVGTDRTYAFREEAPGTYPITIRASNIDGETVREIDVEVVETMPYEVRFPTPSYTQTSTDRHTFAGRPVYLRPSLEYFDRPQYRWSVNGETAADADERTFRFTPKTPGEYTVSVTVTEGADAAQQLSRNITRAATSVTVSVKVLCEEQTEQEHYREATAASSARWNKVYEYTPAPGQFVNEPKSGFSGAETTPEAAAEYAAMRLESSKYVSLGSFGGYIVVGFDHSIRNSGEGYDFAIGGNALEASNEPGVVWVMQDTNGDGLPNDEWYELKGSESEAAETIRNYEVTYYRPEDKGADVKWTDSEGESGQVDYLAAYHAQDSYYPAWIAASAYTLVGTRLSARNRSDAATGFWSNDPFEWGYADNLGNDRLESGDTADGSGQRNGFRIANAVYADGTPVELQYIDFIKVQCGVLARSGWLGEISTEVCSFEDLTIAR